MHFSTLCCDSDPRTWSNVLLGNRFVANLACFVSIVDVYLSSLLGTVVFAKHGPHLGEDHPLLQQLPIYPPHLPVLTSLLHPNYYPIPRALSSRVMGLLQKVTFTVGLRWLVWVCWFNVVPKRPSSLGAKVMIFSPKDVAAESGGFFQGLSGRMVGWMNVTWWWNCFLLLPSFCSISCWILFIFNRIVNEFNKHKFNNYMFLVIDARNNQSWSWHRNYSFNR